MRCRGIEKWIFHAVLSDSLKNPFDSSFARYVSGEHISLIHQPCQNIKLVTTHHSPIMQTALRHHASGILQGNQASTHQASDAARGPAVLLPFFQASILCYSHAPNFSAVLQSAANGTDVACVVQTPWIVASAGFYGNVTPQHQAFA